MMMTIWFLTAAITLFTTIQTSLGNYENIFNSYAKTRLIIECLGEESIQEYTQKVASAISDCNGMKHPDDISPSSVQNLASSSSVNNNFNIRPTEALFESSVNNPVMDIMRKPYNTNIQNPHFSDFNWEDLFDPSKRITFQNRRIIPIPIPISPEYAQRFNTYRSHRKKRSSKFMYFPESKVRSLKNKVVHSISNFTCVLRKMNYINTKDQLQFDVLEYDVRKLKIDSDLKTDLLEGMNQCARYTTCMPFDQIPSALGTNLKKVMSFLKCFDDKRFLSCMKHDFRSHKDHFGLKGLDGVLENLHEDDQMMAIAWSDITMNRKDFTDIIF